MQIRDAAIAGRVEDELRDGLLWPDPLIQLNPSFEPGPWVDDLVAEGVLHEDCRRVFRRDKAEGRLDETGGRCASTAIRRRPSAPPAAGTTTC